MNFQKTTFWINIGLIGLIFFFGLLITTSTVSAGDYGIVQCSEMYAPACGGTCHAGSDMHGFPIFGTCVAGNVGCECEPPVAPPVPTNPPYVCSCDGLSIAVSDYCTANYSSHSVCRNFGDACTCTASVTCEGGGGSSSPPIMGMCIGSS